MKIIKFTLVFVAILIFSDTALSQVEFGAKVNLGSSWIGSGNLKDNLQFQANGDIDIKEWSVSNRPGLMIGIGGVANYALTDKLFLQGELSFNYQRVNINISYLEDDRRQGNTGTTETIDSEAKIFSTRLSVPVTLHYSLGLDKPTLLAGFEMNFLNTPQIESIEFENEKDFENGTLVDEQTGSRAINADLDVFDAVRLNFLIGVAKSIDLAGKQLSLQLTYHLPLTTSPMYNSINRDEFDNNTFNNDVFGALGKVDAEQNAPAYMLNDYKIHFLDFSVTYLF